MDKRLCVYCDHFEFERLTAGMGYNAGDVHGGLTCRKAHYTEKQPYDTEAFRTLLQTASECADFDEVK